MFPLSYSGFNKTLEVLQNVKFRKITSHEIPFMIL